MSNKVLNFIKFSEINEDENPNPDPNATPDAAPAEGPEDASAAPTDKEPTDEPQEEPTGEGIPEIIKVYTDSPEDLEELKEAGIDVEGEDAGETGEDEDSESTDEEGSEGLEGDEAIGEDVLYIKVKTVEGDDVILKFTEADPENRTPVEGEEDTFDTELVAQHGDHEYRITAEIKVNPQTGEEEELDVQPEAQVEEQPAGSEEGAEPTEPTGEEASEEENPNPVPENRTFEQKIMNFAQFVNEAKMSKKEKDEKKKKKEDLKKKKK
jgi:hypothetical protein